MDDTPRCFGGKGYIDTLDGHQLMFHLYHGVLTICCPTNEEMKHLDVIELTSDLPWDTTKLDEEEVCTEDAIAIAKVNSTRTKPAP